MNYIRYREKHFDCTSLEIELSTRVTSRGRIFDWEDLIIFRMSCKRLDGNGST